MIQPGLKLSPLVLQLRERIRRAGPISFYDWMSAALYDPAHGYYCRANKNKWGREGDYRTSPECSSLFSATFARYFARLYDELDRPAKWTIVEVGAGAGHFAAGVLRTLQTFFPTVFSATSYVVDELGKESEALAMERLREFSKRVTFESPFQAELNPGVVFSNELLDALPVHRLSFSAGEFNEFYVTVNTDGDFAWELRPLTPALRGRVVAYFKTSGLQPSEGQTLEACFDIGDWLKNVACKLSRGYVVTVDYGFSNSGAALGNRDTLRGFHRHQFVDDLLARPGEHDLTTTVNWDFVKSAGNQQGLETVEFERQDKFLMAAGLLDQLEIESANCHDEGERLRLTTSAREMILPNGMSTHFQVLVQKKI